MIEKIRSLTTGHRKLIVFFGTCFFLLTGLVLALLWPVAGLALYGVYTAGVATAGGVFTVGNVKEQPKP